MFLNSLESGPSSPSASCLSHPLIFIQQLLSLSTCLSASSPISLKLLLYSHQNNPSDTLITWLLLKTLQRLSEEKGIHHWALRCKPFRSQQRNLHSKQGSAREEDQMQVSAILPKPREESVSGVGSRQLRRVTQRSPMSWWRKWPLAPVSSCRLLTTVKRGVGRKSSGAEEWGGEKMWRFLSVILNYKYNLHPLFICQFPETSQELYAVSLHIHNKLILNPNRLKSNQMQIFIWLLHTAYFWY